MSCNLSNNFPSTPSYSLAGPTFKKKGNYVNHLNFSWAGDLNWDKFFLSTIFFPCLKGMAIVNLTHLCWGGRGWQYNTIRDEKVLLFASPQEYFFTSCSLRGIERSLKIFRSGVDVLKFSSLFLVFIIIYNIYKLFTKHWNNSEFVLLCGCIQYIYYYNIL